MKTFKVLQAQERGPKIRKCELLSPGLKSDVVSTCNIRHSFQKITPAADLMILVQADSTGHANRLHEHQLFDDFEPLRFLLQLVDPFGGSSSLQLFYFLNGALTDVHDFFVDRIAHNDRRRATNFLDFDTSWESLDHITRLFERLGPVFGSLALVMPVRMHFIVQPGQEAEELQVLYTLRIIRALYAREDHWRAIPASSRSVLHG